MVVSGAGHGQQTLDDDCDERMVDTVKEDGRRRAAIIAARRWERVGRTRTRLGKVAMGKTGSDVGGLGGATTVGAMALTGLQPNTVVDGEATTRGTVASEESTDDGRRAVVIGEVTTSGMRVTAERALVAVLAVTHCDAGFFRKSQPASRKCASFACGGG